MHVGGLAPKEEESADAPESARRHAEALRELWRGFEPYWADRAMAPTRRWRQGLRPVNFPERRLAAVARMLARSMETGRPILAAIGDRVAAEAEGLAKAKAARRVHPALKDLFGLFEIEAPGSFWATHYSFRAKPAARAMVLIGQAAARSLVFNAVLPALVLLARRREDEKLEAAARRLYAIFPPLPDNHITDFMSRRLFGETTRAKDLMVTERRRQGLYQIFYSCCNGETRTCDRCYYLNSE
jgi:hypothetical protein